MDLTPFTYNFKLTLTLRKGVFVMARNIKYQFLHAIDANFRKGMDKHSDQKSGIRATERIYSFSDRRNLIDFSANLANFLKVNYPEVKMIKDIKPSMIQEFLDQKAKTCTQATLEQYVSKLNKLEKIVNSTYKTVNVSWSKEVQIPTSELGRDKIRDIAFSREDLDLILRKAEEMNSTSQAKIAIECAARFALRVSETCHIRLSDIDEQKMQLHIHESKGGRSRDIEISKDDLAFLKKAFEGKSENERLISIKEDSVNRWLSRMEEKCGIREKYRNTKSGVHAIRKMKAQELYDEYRQAGYSKEEALAKTSVYLGHGENRKKLMEQYVLHIH